VKATINVEFTDDELRKYGEDVARRVGLNFIRDTVKAFSKVKVSPGLGGMLEQVLASALGSKPQADPGPTAEAPSSVPIERCVHIEATLHNEESWMCCRCSAMNGVHRTMCRSCTHERCDDVVPPSPSPRQSDPSVQ
jgi:ribosomal protein L40E